MEKITIKGKIEFCEVENKGYNREFEAILEDSNAFAYGNQTQVLILFGRMANGEVGGLVLLDTRYDRTIKRNENDFKMWIQKYFEEHYAEHVLTLY
ncbi:MAG: hypothetical protein K2L52_03500 [Clostridia bacterium]|nr:hypothetical protein [Clostridia bacterium]